MYFLLGALATVAETAKGSVYEPDAARRHKKYTAATIAEKLDYYGSWLELSSSSEYAYITVYSLNKYLAKTLEVVESMIKEPLFPEKELHTILDTNIQQYLVNTSKVDFLAHRSLLQSLYGEQHPCGRIVVEEDYHAITPEVLP